MSVTLRVAEYVMPIVLVVTCRRHTGSPRLDFTVFSPRVTTVAKVWKRHVMQEWSVDEICSSALGIYIGI